jgi:hypothetical protein
MVYYNYVSLLHDLDDHDLHKNDLVQSCVLWELMVLVK